MHDSVIWLQNSAQSIQPFVLMLRAFAALFGLGLLGICISRFASNNRAGAPQSNADIFGIFVGIALFSVEGIIRTISNSWLGGYFGPSMDYAFQPVSTSDEVKASLQVIVLYMSVLGWVLTVRGILLFYSGPKYNKENWLMQALWLLLLASAAMNFYVVVDMISNTFSGEKVGTEYFKFDYNN